MKGIYIWVRHGRAQKDRIAERVRKRDLYIVGIQESWEKEGGEGGQEAKLDSTNGEEIEKGT